jgi:hypothetical protein
MVLTISFPIHFDDPFLACTFRCILAGWLYLHILRAPASKGDDITNLSVRELRAAVCKSGLRE